MYGEHGYALVKELSNNTDNLPPYNIDLINAVSKEIKQLVEQNQEDANISADEGNEEGSIVSTIRTRHAAVKRNIRCLVAYHHNRLKSLRTMRWDFGSILPAEIRSNLSADEIEWFSNYSRNIAAYMRSIGEDGVNLAIDMQPPKALYIEVRCLIDYGKFELDDGSVILLKKDSRHYLPRNECEELIRQGVLQHII